jgi:NAD(P)-dependent dehydrogenase (short-subunit alcohol dehydrogenase family)
MSFKGSLAVITGAADGIGKALAANLLKQGCSLALCDVNHLRLEEVDSEMRSMMSVDVPKILTRACDVSDEEQVQAFASEVAKTFDVREHRLLLFNNAGIIGGNSFFGPKQKWDRVFDVNWKGTYNMCRAFMPLLVAAPSGHVINSSSIKVFCTHDVDNCLSAYTAAKCAIKGFSESLIDDLKKNAPHVKVSVTFAGWIGTGLVENSGYQLHTPRAKMDRQSQFFRTGTGSLRPEQAAEVILRGVHRGRWRILVGPDASSFDRLVRCFPEQVNVSRTFKRADLYSFVGKICPCLLLTPCCPCP